MVTQKLLDEIIQEFNNGGKEENIKNSLFKNGWKEEDINEAFNQIKISTYPNKSKNIKSPRRILLIVLIIFIILILLGGGGIYLYSFSNRKNVLPIITTLQTETSCESNTLLPTSTGLTNFSLPKPPYSLIIYGDIEKNSFKVNLKEFFIITKYTKNIQKTIPSPNSEFKILLKKNGATFYENVLDAKECNDWSPGDYCGGFDYSYGTFIERFDNFSELPDEIVFQHLGKDVYTLKQPTTTAPTLAINNQEYKDGEFNISWLVNGDCKKLNYMAYASNNNFQDYNPSEKEAIVPILDGSNHFNGNSLRYSTKNSLEGDVQIAIYANDGFNTYVAYSKTFTTLKSQVSASIVFPENGKTYIYEVPLDAYATAPSSGLSCHGCEKEGNSYVWTSNIDGIISKAARTNCYYLTPGNHQITLNVKNENGTETNTSVNIIVKLPTDIDSEKETRLTKQKNGEFCF